MGEGNIEDALIVQDLNPELYQKKKNKPRSDRCILILIREFSVHERTTTII